MTCALSETIDGIIDRQLEEAARGHSPRVIDEADVVDIVNRLNITLGRVYVAALRNGIWPKRYVRNLGMLCIEDQLCLMTSQVTIIGAGGLGGTLILLLARLGIGTLVVVDHDVFDETNLNRQAISTGALLGKPKASCAAEMVKAINPSVTVQAFTQKTDAENTDHFLEGSSLVVDALDNIQDRFILEAAAKSKGIPYIFGAIAGFMGQVMTVYPDDPGLEKIYGNSDADAAKINGTESIVGVPPLSPSLIGTIQAMEVLKVLLNRDYLLRRDMLYIDMETMQFERIPAV